MAIVELRSAFSRFFTNSARIGHDNYQLNSDERSDRRKIGEPVFAGGDIGVD
jgi:hypothetical protein